MVAVEEAAEEAVEEAVKEAVEKVDWAHRYSDGSEEAAGAV